MTHPAEPTSTSRLTLPAAVAFGVLTAIGYFAAARLSYAFGIPQGSVTLWVPSGLMVGLLARRPRPDWPFIVTGGLVGSVASDLLSQYSISLAIVAALANGIETLVSAWLLTRVLGTPVRLTSLRAVIVFALGAAVISTAVTTPIGAMMLNVGFGMRFETALFIWWAGDGLGTLIVGPAVIAWADVRRHEELLSGGRRFEAVILVVVLAAAAQIAVGPSRGWLVTPGPYAIFPFLFWAALRFGVLGAATGTLIVAGVVTWHAAHNAGTFLPREASMPNATMQVYGYLALVSLSALIPAAILEDRKKALRQLWDSKERYRNVVETAIDAIITIGEDAVIRFANPAAFRIFGYQPVEIIGRSIAELIPEVERQARLDEFRSHLETGGTLPWPQTFLTGLRKDGREVPLEVSFGQRIEDGQRLFTGILRDISDKLSAEETLSALEERYRQSQKMEAIGQLAGGIAHDFNNLLTVIRGFGTLLADEVDRDSPLQSDITQILQAADRAAALTQQLLAFSRRQMLAPRVLDLADSIHAISPMIGRLIGEHIRIVIRAEPGQGAVMADPGQVEQVILNLALNARDAMPNGGTLLIELEETTLDDAYAARHVEVKPGAYLTLSVSDTGAGMDPATLARVFEPFFTTKPKGTGTGLGLATVEGIVRQSGGSVTVYSEPGIGTTFKVYLPRVDASVDVRPQPAAERAAHGTETVLIVEDEEHVRGLAQRILAQYGYRVQTASRPSEALSLATAVWARIDLLLLDVIMPEMSGRSLAEQILAIRPGTCVLYMSGYTDDAIGHHGVLEPGTWFIHKPFTPLALAGKVREVLDAARGS